MKNPIAVNAIVKGLVCGMDVDTATAAGHIEYKGHTYYFCGLNCKDKFDASPEQYLNHTAANPKKGCGCCS